MLNTYPSIEPEAFFNLVGDTKARLVWDHRWVKGSIIKEDGDSVTMHCFSPKPPVPMVSEREFVTQIFNLRDVPAPGLFFNLAHSVNDPSKPVATGMFATPRGLVEVQGLLIEANPNGKGTKTTEVRSMNMGGSIPGAVIGKMKEGMA